MEAKADERVREREMYLYQSWEALELPWKKSQKTMPSSSGTKE